MSLNRAVFCTLFLAYMALARPPHFENGLAVTGLGMLVTIAIFIHVVLRPGANPARRLLALVADLGVICYDMHLGGSATALFYPLLLWTILGNGLRFGIASLVTATLLGVAGFALVVLSTPFWFRHPSLALGLLAGLVLIPIYAGSLLKSLSRAKLAAEAANNAKTAFLASLSHELRTPLHAIIGSGSLLGRGRLSPEQAELTGTIVQASKSLLGMIDDLLNYSRIEAGALKVEDADFTLPALLLEVRDILLPGAEAKGLRFALHVGPQTPPAFCGDRRHIAEILLNLVSNAIKFTSFGGVLVSAGAAREEAGGVTLRFEVTDTGIGVPPEAHGRIFERFTQADESIGARFGGTGLGLAICKRLVERLGGQIGLRSQPGSGSTFWFELPVARAAGTAAPLPWPATVIGLGLEEPAVQAVANAAEAAGAKLRLAGFEGLDLSALVRASAGPEGPLLIAAPASPAQAEALITATRGEGGSLLPALIVLGTAAARTAEMRWIAPTLLASGGDGTALAAAVQAALALARARERYAGEEAPSQAAIRPLRILLADDNQLNQRVVGAILASGGHRYDVVANGEAALDALQAGEYDLVLMDVNMPVLDGIEATRLYRVMSMGQPHLPIIGVTADATSRTAERCREAGMDRCLVKPLTAQDLLAAIADAVQPGGPPQAAEPALPVPIGAPALAPVAPRGVASAPAFVAPAAAEDRVLDEARLRDLSLLGGDGFVIELLHGFAGEGRELADEIASAVHDNNWAAFRSGAHAVASSAANLGAVRLHRLANAVEQLGPAEIRIVGPAKVQEIRRELDRLQRAAAEYEAGLRQGAAPPAAGPARAAGDNPAARPRGHSAASWG